MSVLTKLRRLGRRSLKPLVMAGIAATLVLSLTVTTTQRAEATPAIAVAPVILAAESIIGGAALPFAMPSLLATSLALHPVGWAIAAVGAVIGVGLFATKDYWLPWAQEQVGDYWGKAKGGTPSTPYTGSNVWAGMSMSAHRQVNATVWEVSGYDSEPHTGPHTRSFAVAMECKDPATGQTVKQRMSYQQAQGTSVAAGPRLVQFYCATNTVYKEVVGAVVGAHGSDPEVYGYCPTGTSSDPCWHKGPNNVYKFGTFLGESQPAFDPSGADVKYKTTVECINAAGTRAELSAESAGDEGGVKVPSCAAAGLGHGTGKMSVDGYAPTAPGVPGTAPTPLWSSPAPTVAPDHPQKLCDPNRPGDGCKMAITIDGKPCVVGSWDCENWTEIWKDPNTAPRVGCTYGPYALAVDLCTVMEPAYRPGGAPANESNTDGNPDTRNYTQPGGQVYNPPATGTGTAPGGFPSAGTNPSTGTSPNCSAPEWSWNPVEFVKNPVLCAMQDAFVPKTDIQMRSDALRDQASEVVPISWLANPITGPSGGGCPNWTINVQGLSQNVVCNSSFTQALTGVRGPLFGLVAAAMVWPLMRSIWYASIPVLRVSPGSSK